MITGWYYLHENGRLIYKRDLPGIQADFAESTLVRSYWPLDKTDRAGAWRILVEALSLGADRARIDELADKWRCNDADDGGQWCATRGDFVDLQESPSGFGDNALEALAALCRDLRSVGAGMWRPGFAELTKLPTASTDTEDRHGRDHRKDMSQEPETDHLLL